MIDGTGYVFELGVDPQHAGPGDRQGAAQAFLRELRGSRDPHRPVWAWTRRTSPERIELYRSVGMKPVREHRRRREAHRSPARLLTPAERGPT